MEYGKYGILRVRAIVRGWRVAPGSGFSVENGGEYAFPTRSKISRVSWCQGSPGTESSLQEICECRLPWKLGHGLEVGRGCSIFLGEGKPPGILDPPIASGSSLGLS